MCIRDSLTCFGLIMLYSTSAYTAELQFGDDMHFFKRQALISVASILGALFISRVDYHLLVHFKGILYIAAMILMGLVQTPLGEEVNGARRWLKLGIQFQPAEIAKIAVIVCLPYMIVEMGKRIKTLKACMILGVAGGALAFVAYVFTCLLYTSRCV